jgi:hypothetical protein
MWLTHPLLSDAVVEAAVAATVKGVRWNDRGVMEAALTAALEALTKAGYIVAAGEPIDTAHIELLHQALPMYRDEITRLNHRVIELESAFEVRLTPDALTAVQEHIEAAHCVGDEDDTLLVEALDTLLDMYTKVARQDLKGKPQ